MSAIYSFLKYLRQRQAVVTLKIHNSGWIASGDTFFDPSPPLFGFRPILWETLDY